MLYYVKSFVKGVAKNGRPYYKLSLVGEDGNAVSATCFSALEYDPGDYIGGTIVSDLSPLDQFPKVTDAELSTILPLMAPVPEAFKKFVNPTVTPETIALTPHCILGAEEVEKRYSGYFEPRDLQLIKHIILSHHGKPEFGAACAPATLDAFLVHTIDMLSGQGYAMSHCANLERCGFTSSLVVVP